MASWLSCSMRWFRGIKAPRETRNAVASDPTSPSPSERDLTELLADVSRDASSWNDVADIVYGELHALASLSMRGESATHTLQPTALVHEVFLRLFSNRDISAQSRAHFLGIAASIMRRVLVDYHRARIAKKRGGEVMLLALDDVDISDGAPVDPIDPIALDEALREFAEIDPHRARMIELRFFGGLSIEQTAEVLEISTSTVKREWRVARAWLLRRLGDEPV